ncbi:PIG-L deacetylase family protein [Streptomyces sp. VRA16 Mangrove soil]|uniref:PIG-L deacetylase family protein n=1 Tax=Streptomyces sp. VRA16 Mangrove soil TaxID=2817434 RepID=UPI001A9D4FB4|nr:PIG-L deacetylase family protein [Streptomyces sp. VRA16 Mangrove soil]MBO1330798.1 PIG-L family deacetylase [Streptomyces sp. VRA16 Mangrove soil]
MWERILAVGAHPDDIEFGCGGALLCHAAQGASITLVVVSDGSRGGDAVSRAAEQERAAELLGAKVVMLGLPDGQLGPVQHVAGLLEAEMAHAAPDLVYTHLPEDTHQDHITTHQATRIATRRHANVLLYESPRSALLSSGIAVNISVVMAQKLALLSAHTSQIREGTELDAESVRARALVHGRRFGCGFAEIFTPLRFALPFAAAR